MRRWLGWGLCCTALVVASCAGGDVLDAPYAGRTAAYEPGVPAFDLEPVAAIRNGQAGLEIYAALSPATLIFAQTDTSYAARYDLAVRILDERGRKTVTFQAEADTVVVPDLAAAASADRARHRMWFALAPGRYVVEATLGDAETEEHAIRRQRVEVPDPADRSPRLGRPLLFARGDSIPTVALHLPADSATRSVRTPYQHVPGDTRFEASLYRLVTDTTVADPPFWIGAARGSLAYRAIDDNLARADTVLVYDDAVDPSAAVHEAVMPNLGPGLYRYDLVLRDAAGETIAQSTRLVSVQDTGFPRLTTLDALIDALAYIAYPRELAYIQAGETARERKLRFDAFWGSLVPDRRVAANALRQYGERVEEANRRFTGFKPGWKTDRGMIFILFGAPVYVEQTFDGEVWHYGTRDVVSQFVFERRQFGALAGLFEQPVLLRQASYEQMWSRARARWRRGDVR